MKITIFGTGIVGQTIAEKLSDLGHDTTMGTRNVKVSLAKTGRDSFGGPPLNEWVQSHH